MKQGGIEEERDRDRVVLESENYIYFKINFESSNYTYFEQREYVLSGRCAAVMENGRPAARNQCLT